MKITITQIRKLIQEQLFQEHLLQEQVFGNLAYVYHGSKDPPDVMYDYIKNKTFIPGKGSGDWYGPGLYTVREFDPKLNTFNERYGPYVYKFKANLAGIVSFDSDVTQQIYGKKLSIIEQIQSIINNNLVDQKKAEVLKKFLANNKNKNFNTKEYHFDHSSVVALGNWESLITTVRGISFTGSRDGPVIIFYSLDGIVPLAWAETGKNKAKEDYKWQPLKIGSQSQNYDYESFDEIKTFFKSKDKIKNLIEKINNPTIFNIILKFIEASGNSKVKIFITELCHKSIPKEKSDIILEKLSNDADPAVKSGVADNIKCSPEILEKLSIDEPSVQKIVASNPKCPLPILKKLSINADPEVRISVAYNNNCPKEIREKLSKDENPKVRHAAEFNL